jgi:hypothetical protein
LDHKLPSAISLADIVNVFTRHFLITALLHGRRDMAQSAEASVMAYIRNKTERHRNRSFQEEYLEFLKKHRIEYDEPNLWD